MRSTVLFCFVVVAGLTGCNLVPAGSHVPEYAPELIDGTLLFGDEVTIHESEALDILETNAAMEAFVADAVAGKLEFGRYRRLLDKLDAHGYFQNNYDAGVTSTAADTFDRKVGNCISYTNMFVALARAANLRAHFQLVERRYPTWTVDGGMLMRNNHVNVFVEGPGHRAVGHTVDFNFIDPDPDAKTRLISDGFATSLFYANLSVDELLAGNDRRSFSYLRRAIEGAPENDDLWINLGAMYSRYDRHEYALQAYAIARTIGHNEMAVLSGMERSLRALGQTERANELERKVRRYRNSNPYYHFALAQVAYEEGAFDESLDSVNRAIKMRKRNPRFHFLKGLNLYQLGDNEGAKANFLKAREFGRYDDLWLRYTRETVEPDLTG